MPQTKSAKKALRQAKRRRATNLASLKKLKTAVKNFKKTEKSTDFVTAQSLIDKAAKKRVIARNKAARLKSRLSQLLPQNQRLPSASTKVLTKRKSPGKLKKSRTKSK